MKPTQENYVPSHAEFIVQFVPGDYRSSLVSRKAFAKGDIMVYLRGLTKGPKRYTSVQCGKGAADHVELNSDLVYLNHSCEPNVAFDLSSRDPKQWHLRALKPINVGEALCIFYPSTEWSMDQPFKCECGTPTCIGTVTGAKSLSKKDLLAREWVSRHILELVAEQDGGTKLQSRL